MVPAEQSARGRDLLARLIGGLLALIGLGLLAAAAAVAVSQHRFVKTAARAPGVVARLNAGGAHPEVQFMTARGQAVSYPQGGMIFGYRVGDRVTVLYDPRQPVGTACISAPGALWDGAAGLTVLGLAFFGVGLAGARGSRYVYVRGLEQGD